MKKSIFYSWQSDRPNPINRGFIGDCIKLAIESVRKESDLQFEPCLERDTMGTPGTPDIANTILRKIENSHMFIADVTLINDVGDGDFKPTPNPNVLFELGYAVRHLGWDKVILVANTAFGTIEKLPFDLRSRRIMCYHLSMTQLETKPDAKKELSGTLKNAIEGVFRSSPFYYSLSSLSHGIQVTVTAKDSHNPAPSFLVTCRNRMGDFNVMAEREAFKQWSCPPRSLSKAGIEEGGYLVKVDRLISSDWPLAMNIVSPSKIPIELAGVYYQLSPDKYQSIPPL